MLLHLTEMQTEITANFVQERCRKLYSTILSKTRKISGKKKQNSELKKEIFMHLRVIFLSKNEWTNLLYLISKSDFYYQCSSAYRTKNNIA